MAYVHGHAYMCKYGIVHFTQCGALVANPVVTAICVRDAEVAYSLGGAISIHICTMF